LAVLLFVGVATALPVGDSEGEAVEIPRKRQAPYAPAPVYKPAPPPVYKAAPAPYKAPHPEAKLPPQPYQFEYGVADQYTGTNFQAVENQDEKGTVIGSYRVNLPDGRVQTVTYTADHYGGFVADVSYEGEAQYPPEKEHKPYAPPPPKYAPA
jgi:hypothetical protein